MVLHTNTHTILLSNCSIADQMNLSEGRLLYEWSRDELRDRFGVSEGVRLFSQLQRDKGLVR